ncbi:hypothetical protein B7Z17_03905 [Candidatus Saccharibacteria bacterium 32-49-10]|nr:MAG: hypothetical protein B7Z17_03905 [Candidatus Saccharibacteria bacterium 32-49-10]
MKRKILLTLQALILVTVALVGILYLWMQSTMATDEQIRLKFQCDRITADARKTDVYCRDPNLYRDHVEQGTVIE